MADRRPDPSSPRETELLLPLAVTDDLVEGIVVVDRASRIRYANPAMTRIFGYGRDELVGASLTMLMPERHRPRHREALESYLATGERNLSWMDVDLPGLHRDGSELPLRVSFSELHQGGRRLFAGAIRDLSAATPAEARRTADHRHQVLFEADVAAVFRCAPDGRILASNAAFAELTGREAPEDLVGEHLGDVWAEGASRDRMLEDVRRRRDVHNREVRVARREGGDARWCLVNAVWIGSPSGADPEALVGTAIDISRRKRAEREFRLSAQRYRRLFEQRLVGVYRSRPEPGEGVIECNEAFATMFGYEGPPQAKVAGRNFYARAEDRRRTMEELRKRGSFVNRELELRRRDGSPIWVLAHSRLVEDPEHGEVIEGLFFDITEEVRTRRALRRAKEKFQGVFDISPVGLKIVDPETDRYLQVNRAFERIFGCDRGQVLDGTVGRGELWENPEKEGRLYERVRRGQTVRNEEVRLRRTDGTSIDGLFSAGALEVDDETYIVAAVQDITRQKEVERELERRALHDQLTGLPNRSLFTDRLQHALARARRSGELLAILVVDLDGFRRVNDALGRGAGDRVLRQLSGRLSSNLREQDTAARVGGDEFGVVLEGLEREAQVIELTDRLLERLSEPVEVSVQRVRIDASCGIACWGGDPGRREAPPPEPDELLRHADLAMYAAKEEPGSSWRIHDAEVEAAEPTRLREEMRLRRGIEDDEFTPYYQPIFSLDDHQIVGAEVLARWERGAEDPVPPGTFIPLAEETGLILELGRRLTDRALRDFARWREEGTTPADFRLHLNLSARQLRDPELVAWTAALLEEASVDPRELTFEVTESAAMARSDVMGGLQELGVGLSVDDFGTEYSTLHRMTELEVDSLKVDRTFVGRMTGSQRHAAIVEATLALADALGIAAVAEGIETEEELERLRDLGCPYGQGFLFARPLPADDFVGMLEGLRG